MTSSIGIRKQYGISRSLSYPKEQLITMSPNNSLIHLAILCLITTSLAQQQFKLRQVIDYSISFSSESQVSALFATCGNIPDFRTVLLSFLFYNTHPIRVAYLVDYCQTPVETIKQALPNGRQREDLFKVVSFKGKLLDVFSNVLPLVQTAYLYSNVVDKYVAVAGFGWMQQALDILQWGNKNKMNISQVTFLFKEWSQYQYLGQMHLTPAGTRFHYIHTFKPKDRQYFTFKPSIFEVNFIWKQVLGEDISAFATKSQCEPSDEVCVNLAMGKQINEKLNYEMAFVNYLGGRLTNVYKIDKDKEDV